MSTLVAERWRWAGGRPRDHSSNLQITESILNGEAEGKPFYEIIEQSEPYGWQTFDQAILRVRNEGSITEETAWPTSLEKAWLAAGRHLEEKRVETITDIEGLSLD